MSTLVQAEQSSTPSTPSSGKVKVYSDNTAIPQRKMVDDAGNVITFLDNKHQAVLIPGTTLVAPLNIPAASVLKTAPAQGDIEADGINMYFSDDATVKQGFIPSSQIFRLTSTGASFSTIADAFAATGTGFPFVLNGIYLIECLLIYSKTTAGTVTWTLTNTQNYTAAQMFITDTPLTGVATGAATAEATVAITAAATIAVVSGSKSTGVNHVSRVWAVVEMGTAGNVRLRGTASAGTAQLLRGSFMRMTRLPGGNVGAFVT